MPRYKQEVSRYVNENVNIVDLIGSTVNLKRSGRNYMGLCPFHNEKTPSFSVSGERNMFKCFGCGESGDCITFAMKDRGLEFIEAIEWLSDRYSIDLSEYMESADNSRQYDSKILFEIMKESARFYFKNLLNNKRALQYLLDREIKKETIYEFGLGYSPDAWNLLYDYLKSKGFKDSDMLLCGMIKSNHKGGYYDGFRNRIMFPIFDNRGRVCAFGGRVLDNSMPKYLNSQETPIFNKSKILYGLNFVNKNYKGRELIIVEGYMDLIALNQHGIRNVVATLGTALNIEHVKLMKRNFEDIIFAFDGDKAGRSAIFRSLPEFDNSGLKVRILELGEYKDPDEYIKKAGKQLFGHQLEQAVGEIDFKIKYIMSDYNLDESFDRLAFLNRVYHLIANLTQDVQKEIYLERLSKLVRLDLEAIKKDYKNVQLEKEKGQNLHLQHRRQDSHPKEFNHEEYLGHEEYDFEHLEGMESEHGEVEIGENSSEEFFYVGDMNEKIKNVKRMRSFFKEQQSQNPLLQSGSKIDKIEKSFIRCAMMSTADFQQVLEYKPQFMIYENILAFALLEVYYENYDELRISNLVSLFSIDDIDILKRISELHLPISENLIQSLLKEHEFLLLELEMFQLDREIRQLQLEPDIESEIKLRLKLSQKVDISKRMLEMRKNTMMGI